MSYLEEYIEKLRKNSAQTLITERTRLIKKFNRTYNAFLFIYAASIEANTHEVALHPVDYETIHDLVKDKSGGKIVFYIETKGGSGDAARDIAELLHKKFDEVHFLVAGEAKSAGTILALSGDEILMTETGSLGPIDAQVTVGRSAFSAHGYMTWVEQKREESIQTGKLSPFDATMVAQISPGELNQVNNALNFAINLVKTWLPQYKFKNWTKTETNGYEVTSEMKEKRAEEIARDLTDQSRWNSHGRSLKINDLKDLGIKIISVDEDPVMADIVYRIKAINRLLFDTLGVYKFFVTDVHRIQRSLTRKNPPGVTPMIPNLKNAELITLDINCSKCHKKHSLYAKFKKTNQFDQEMKAKGIKPVPKNKTFKCDCGTIIDLVGPLTEMETRFGKKIIL
jgi:ClpP class serine protease